MQFLIVKFKHQKGSQDIFFSKIINFAKQDQSYQRQEDQMGHAIIFTSNFTTTAGLRGNHKNITALAQIISGKLKKCN